MWARGRCRISPARFLAECCKRQLNQVSFVVLYFRLSTFSDLYWVCLSAFSCTVLFVSISQVIGCEDRLRNDLYCVDWGVKLYSNQPAVDLTPSKNHDFVPNFPALAAFSVFWQQCCMQGRPKKWGHAATDSWSQFCQISITGRFLGKFVVKWILKILPHIAYVATLRCETLLSAKRTINYKLQGSVG